MNLNKIKTYIWSIAIPVAVGLLSAVLTMGQMDLYQEINQPLLAPPPWLFPVVWTILYVLMGISFARIVLSDQPDVEKIPSYFWYVFQLFFNFFWSIWFFNFRAFEFSFVWIVILWYGILRMILAFYQIDKIAAKLQIPYLLWVTFAAYLNLAIAILN